MKKLSFIAIILFVTGVFFTSCTKDDTKDPPTISFLGGNNYVSGDVTLTAGSQFSWGIAASTNSGKNLNSFKAVRKFENVITITEVDSSFNAASFQQAYMSFAQPAAGTEDWTFTVTDKDGLSSTISFTITTEVAGPDITTYTDKILGAQANNSGSSFASVDGTIYSLADAKANADKIDWLYFYGATNHATIAAPNDVSAASVFNNATNGLQTWTVLNNTKFKMTTINSSAFDAINTSAQIAAVVAVPVPGDSKENNLAVGNILGFTTADGKLGLIRVDAITGTDSGTINITVKVQ